MHFYESPIQLFLRSNTCTSHESLFPSLPQEYDWTEAELAGLEDLLQRDAILRSPKTATAVLKNYSIAEAMESPQVTITGR
jgi:hypothetical protein